MRGMCWLGSIQPNSRPTLMRQPRRKRRHNPSCKWLVPISSGRKLCSLSVSPPQVAFDQAQEVLLSTESSLEAAKAQLGTAKDALGYTELRAGAVGLISARNLEVGQVVQAAQPVFTLAQDGDRDAVFDVY